MKGKSIDRAAGATEVTRNTIRTQLSKIFEKTAQVGKLNLSPSSSPAAPNFVSPNFNPADFAIRGRP